MNSKIYIPILLIFFISTFDNILAQNEYSKGWQALSDGDVNGALVYFEEASLSSSNSSEAILSAAIVYQHTKNFEKASEYLRKYYQTDPNPHAAIYGLWHNEFVIGSGFPNNTYHKQLLDLLISDSRNVGKLDAEALYRLVVHYDMYYKKAEAQKYASQIGALREWSLLGPFDNVMQSGFNKDFGALENTKQSQEFTSQYGAKINWFKPSKINQDRYVYKGMHFNSDNDIVYAQTFFELTSDLSALLKLGYSGVLKLWLNDSLI